MIYREFQPLNYLKQEELEKIHLGAMAVLEGDGVEYFSPEARKILSKAGAKVQGDNVFLPRELVMEQVAQAPSEFTLQARNPENNVRIGGNTTVTAPGYGSPYVMNYLQNKRRISNYRDYIAFTKLCGNSDNFDVAGGVLVEPNDLPDRIRHAKMFQAAVKHTDKCLMGSSMGDRKASECLEMAEIIFSSRDEIQTKPVLITLINTQSPLQFDQRMIEALMVYARNSQPLLISALAMTGTTSPVTLPGSLVQQTAEILSGIVLAQLINPGTPVIFGSSSSIVDLRTGDLAIGSPESTKMFCAIAQMARFYGLPSRGGGALTDSLSPDAQSGYESMMVAMNCVLCGVNFILHSAGMLENYMTMSYEKFIIDDEIIGLAREFARPMVFDEENLAVDVILRHGSGGHYVGDSHTFEHMKETRIPIISSRERYTAPGDFSDAAQKAHQYVASVLQDYQDPPLDEKIEQELSRYIDNMSE